MLLAKRVSQLTALHEVPYFASREDVGQNTHTDRQTHTARQTGIVFMQRDDHRDCAYCADESLMLFF